MAHPKRRQSHTRQAKRRTHDVVKAPTLATCPNCGALHISTLFARLAATTVVNWLSSALRLEKSEN